MRINRSIKPTLPGVSPRLGVRLSGSLEAIAMQTEERNVLDQIVLFNLDIHTWSGRKKLLADDIEGRIPPKKLASLGSKKICDPTKVAKFSSVKRRAERLLYSKGFRLMGAYAVPVDRVKEVVDELKFMKDEFNSLKVTFLNTYHQGIEHWIDEQGEWGKIIRPHITSADYIRNQLSFGWQVFHIQPTQAETEGFDEEVNSMSGRLFNEISRDAASMFEESFLMKDRVGQKSIPQVYALLDKLRGLAFIDGKATAIANMMSDTLGSLPKQGVIEGKDLNRLFGLLIVLSSKQKIVEYGQRILDGEDVTANDLSAFSGLENNDEDDSQDQHDAAETQSGEDESDATDTLDAQEQEQDIVEEPVPSTPKTRNAPTAWL
jgi:hypothetical protein